jgi:glycosyltransferase involved in cell wall biosynthesis
VLQVEARTDGEERRMRIAILHSQYRSGSLSGENRVVADEISLLRSAGHDVLSWCPIPDEGPPLSMAQLGFRAVWSRDAQSRVRALASRFRPDVVHVHNLFPMLSPAILDIGKTIPLVMTLHNYRLMCLPADLFRQSRQCELCIGHVPWKGVLFHCYRNSYLASAALALSLTAHRLASSFDGVRVFIAVSELVRRKHVEGGLPADRILVKGHFTWPTARRRGPGRYLLYVGRLSPEKGITWLAEAWQKSWGQLRIVGDGPEARTLRRLARTRAIELVGPRSPAEVSSDISRARAVVIPSLWSEPFGRSAIEAYAAGVPVIANAVGALSEVVVDGTTGLFVAPRSEAWERAINQLQDDEESHRLGAGAYEAWLNEYSPPANLRQLERIYGEAAGV